MKTIIRYKHVVLWCLFALISQGCSTLVASSADAHIRVVDATGAPVEGAVLYVLYGENARRDFVTDVDGRVVVTCNDRAQKRWGFLVKRVRKTGYDCWDRYLGMPRDYGGAWSEDAPYEHPHLIVVRKMESEPEALYREDIDWNVWIRNDRTPPPAPLSIFNYLDDPDRGAYVDFFVQPHCNRLKKEWVLSLWTTNENAGISATTNRVYVAPESGYRSRVDVTQAEATNHSFTIYLKTRPKGIYAMVPFCEGEIQAGYYSCLTNFSFRCGRVFVNPYGGRNLERDERYKISREVGYFVAKGKSIYDVLKEGQIPPRMDIPARLVNHRRWCDINAQMAELDKRSYVLRTKSEAIRKEMKNRTKMEIDKALESIKRESALVGERFAELRHQRELLDEEIPTLNLPPGMTEKDKYGKVDLELSFRD